MTRALPARRRLLTVLLLFALADVALGPAGCDSCAARVTRTGKGGSTP